MKLELIMEQDKTVIQEDGRTIYTIEEEREEGLLNVYLKNMYNDEVLGMYQIQKWYSRFFHKRMEDFTIYEKDTKLGELHGFKDGYEMEWHSVFYRFYGGQHAAQRVILCVDKDVQKAEFHLVQPPYVRIRDANFNAIASLLLYLFVKHLAADKFNEQAYQSQYQGVFVDCYEFEG